MSTYIRHLMTFIMVLLVLIFSANLIIENPYTLRLTRAIINEQVTKHLGVQIDYETANISLAPLKIDLYGISLKSKNQEEWGEKSELDLQLAHLGIIGSWFSLLVGLPPIETLRFTEPKLYLTESRALLRIIEKLQNNPSDKNLKNPIESIELANLQILSKLHIPESKKPGPYIIAGIENGDVLIHFTKSGEITGNLELDQVKLQQDQLSLLSEAKLTAKFRSNLDNSIQLMETFLTSPKLNLAASHALTIKAEKGTKKGLRIEIPETKIEGDFSLLGSLLDIPETTGWAKIQTKGFLDFPKDPKHSLKLFLATDAAVDRGRIGGVQLFDSQASISITEDKLIFNQLKIIDQGHELGTATGELGFSSEVPYNFQGNITQGNLNKILSLFDSQLDTVDFDFTAPNLQVSGQGDPFQISIHTPKADLHNIQFFDFPPYQQAQSPHCLTELHIEGDHKSLQFAPVTGLCSLPSTNHKMPLSLEGTIIYDGKTDLKFTSNELDLSVLQKFSPIVIEGKGSSKIHINGPNHKMETLIEADLKEVKLQNVSISEISTQASIVDDDILFTKLNASWANFGGLDLGGSKFNTATKQALLVGEGSNIPEGVWSHLFANFQDSKGLSTTVEHLKINWNGNVFNAAYGIGNLNASLSEIKFYDELILDKANFFISGNGETTQISDAILNLNRTNLNGQLTVQKSVGDLDHNFFLSWLGLKPKDSLTFKGNTNPSDYRKDNDDILEHLPFIGKNLSSLGLRSEINFTADIGGTLSHPKGRFRSVFLNSRFKDQVISPLEVDGYLDKSNLTLAILQAGNLLKGNAEIDLSQPEMPYSWKIDFNHFDFRFLMGDWFSSDPRNYSLLSGTWNFKGKLKNWWHSEGFLHIDSLVAKYFYDKASQIRHLFFRNQTPVTMVMDNHGWRLKEKQLNLDSQFMTMNVEVPNSNPPFDLNLKVNGDFQLSFFSLLFDEINQATGTLGYNLVAKGPLDNLGLNINLYEKLNKNGTRTRNSIFMPSFAPEFSDLKLDVNYLNKVIHIKEASIKKGEGQLRASGMFDTSQTHNSLIHIDLNKIESLIPVPILKKVETLTSGKLVLEGKHPPYLLRGEIDLQQVKSTHNFSLQEELLKTLKRSWEAPKKLTETNWINLDLKVSSNHGIDISNKNLKLNGSSLLTLKGPATKPITEGSITINEGWFYYKRPFRIQSGELTFTESSRNDPLINIVSNTYIPPYSLSIVATGKSTNPTINFNVDPSVKEDGTPITNLDGFVLLSKGKLPATRSQSSESGNTTISEAINLYASQLPFDKLLEWSGQNFVQVYLDTTVEESGQLAPQLNVPITATNLVEAIFQTTPNTRSLSLEMPLHESISLTGKYSSYSSQETVLDKNEQTVDLRFHFPFE